MTMENDTILQVKDLNVVFDTVDEQKIYAVNGVNFNLNKGEILALVGESGSGKTQIALSIMNLISPNGKVSGEVLFKGQNLLNLSEKELASIRGTEISMVFQDPMTYLNPYMRISKQLLEVVYKNDPKISRKDALQKCIDIMETVGIPDAAKRINNHLHQFSGGMRQRIMIAMSLLSDKTKILIADEPTTALDVTIQAQVLDVLQRLSRKFDLSVIMITHDLGVVANLADKVGVCYGGKIVEYADIDTIIHNSKHPYTQCLIDTVKQLELSNKNDPIEAIAGQPPLLYNFPKYCAFRDRCAKATSTCSNTKLTPIIDNDHMVSCLLYEENKINKEK